MAVDNDNLTEIPEELFGVSEEIAREIMSQVQVPQIVESEDVSLDLETKPTDLENNDEGDISADETANVDQAEEDDDTSADDIPATQPKGDIRAALKQEREKRKARDMELEIVKKELAEIKAKQIVPPQPSVPPQAQQPTEAQPVVEASKQTDVDQKDYTEKLYAAAENVFVERYKRSPNEKVSVRARAEFVKQTGREPDGFSDEDQDALADIRAQITRDDTIRLNQIVYDLDAGIKRHAEQQQAEQQKRLAEQQQVNTVYADIAAVARAKSDYQDLLMFTVERIKQLPADMRNYVAEAFQRVETGQGTMQDVIVAKQFWEASDLLFEKQKAVVIPDVQKEVVDKSEGVKKAEKVKAANSIPRSVNIGGGATAGNITAAELERKLNDGTISDEELEILKKGG